MRILCTFGATTTHIYACDETFWGRSEELKRRARKQERKKADMDRRERHNERHMMYRARRRQQDEERNRELWSHDER